MKIVTVIPARDEEAALPRVLAEVPGFVAAVIVVDNGSSDATAAVARAGGAVVVSVPQPGYGRACIAGIVHALAMGAEIIVFLDGDYSDYPAQMDRLVAPIIAGTADLVIGSRMLGRRARGSLTPQQYFGNRFACWLIRRIWGFRYTDLGPFRAVRVAALPRLNLAEMTYGWTVEMQVDAVRGGLKIAEVPVDYRVRIGVSKISGTVRGVVLAGYHILLVIGRTALRRGAVRAGAVPVWRRG